MVDKISGAAFFVDIVVADHLFGRQFQFFTEPSCEFYEGVIGGFVVFAGAVWMTRFYGDGVLVAGGVCIGDLADGDALKDFSFQSNNEVAAGRISRFLGILVCQTLEVLTVCLCAGAWISHIVNDNVVDSL